MNFFIQLDEQAAAKVGSSGRIDGDSNHIVKVVQAYYTQNDKGTQTLHLSLINNNGEVGDFALHFRNGQGENLPSYNVIQAIIKLTGIGGITQTDGTYQEYDYEAGRKVEKQGFIAPELIGKFFGAIFTKNYRLNQQGEEKYNVEIYSVYHHKTMQWARQMIRGEQAKPGQTDQMLEQAKKVSERSKANPYNPYNVSKSNNANGMTNNYAPQYTQGGVQPSPMTSMQRPPQGQSGNGYAVNPAPSVADDDIPF